MGSGIFSSLEWHGPNRLSLAFADSLKVFRGRTVVQVYIAE
jgi:hypothetical protein